MMQSPPPKRASGRSLLRVELLLLFGVLPPVLGFLCPPPAWIPVLWVTAVAVTWTTRQRPATDAPPAASPQPDGHLRRILVRFVVLAVASSLAMWLLQPTAFLQLPRRNPSLWVLIIVLYPLLSVVPQEVLFRRWFFRRYATIFGDGRWLQAVSSLCFGWVHVVMRNGLAVALTVAGGWLFGGTYRRSRSLGLVCLEHALYGDLIFTVGLGQYFFHGALH